MNNPAPTDVSTMFALWVAARTQTEVTRLRGEPEQPDVYWTELRLATALSHELLADRWPTVGRLLHLGAVESWTQVGDAIDMTGTDTRDRYLTWVTTQADLFQQTQNDGASPAEAQELLDLARQVPPL